MNLVESMREALNEVYSIEEEKDGDKIKLSKKKEKVDLNPKIKDEMDESISPKEEVEITEMEFEAGKVYHQDTSDGKMFFKAVEQQKNKRWKGLVMDIGQKKPKNGSADEKLRFWKSTSDKDIPSAFKEEVKATRMPVEAPFKLIDTKKEEVEIKEAVSAKDYDSLKKGDTVTIEYKSAMSSGKATFKVTAKNIVGKAKVGKVTLRSVKNPKSVKHFLYKRGDNVTFAQGDMGASVVSFTKEEVEVDGRTRGYRSALSRISTRREKLEMKKKEVTEVAPPGWEDTVKKMKKDKKIDNPFALAWWMKNKGYNASTEEQEWFQNNNSESFKVWAKHYVPEAHEIGTDEYKKYTKKVTPGQNEITEGTGYFDIDSVDKWMKEIEKGIVAPVVNVSKSTLGGADRVSITIKLSLDPKEDWINNIFHNSRYAMFDLDRDGSFKLFSKGLKLRPNKMRKTRVKSAKDVVNKVNTWIKGIKEEVEIGEKKGSDYQLYHKTFSDAMQHAYQHAEKKGFVVDPDEIDNKVATGPKKPSSGKTNRYILGTNKKKKVHIQVANLDNKKYELNMYIEDARDSVRFLKKLTQNESTQEGAPMSVVKRFLSERREKIQAVEANKALERKVRADYHKMEGDKKRMEKLATKYKIRKDEVQGIIMSEDYENVDEKTGDHAEYQKKRAAVVKRFGVKSCSELEGDKKKACYKALDDAHVADHEEEYNLGEANWEESPINDDRYKLSNAAPHMNVRANDDMEGPYMYKDGIFYWSPIEQKFWSEDSGGWLPDIEAKDMMYSFMKGLWQGRKGSLPAVKR